jgi:hypothetical protein
LKERILELLNELYNEYSKIQHDEDDARFQIALKLLSIIDSLHVLDSYVRKNKLFEAAEKQGFHILRPDFYSPLPTVSQLPPDTWDKMHNAGIDWNEKVGISLLEELANYAREYQHILDIGVLNESGDYPTHDSALLYSIIRYFKPINIIQVGSGDSTKVAALAASRNSNGRTNITSIDPFCFKGLEKIVRLIRRPIQEIPLSEFETLERNDILFIDSSHISKIGSDVNYLYLDVFPKLKAGVLIHIHDIFLPYELPRQYTYENHWFWNEQYLLHAFLIGNRDFEILFGTRYMVKYHPELLLKIYGDLNFGSLGVLSNSFWIRKITNK